MPADILHLVEAAHCSRRDIRASIRDDFETVSNLFNDLLLDRDPIRSGKNRRAGLLYSLGSEVCTKIFFFFPLYSFFIRIFGIQENTKTRAKTRANVEIGC